MKTFNDLIFKPHHTGDGLHALHFFPNGYGISVVRFRTFGRYGSYTSNESEWEAAVLFGKEGEWELTYSTEITDDVIGHLSDSDVTELMAKIQRLPNAQD